MKYLVVDISTTAHPDIEDSYYLSWANKNGALTPEDAYSKAGLHAEFGMICGLSAFIVEFKYDRIGSDANPVKASLKEVMNSTAGDLESESALLEKFASLLDSNTVIVGHNVKDFVIPFLAKRYLGDGLKVPRVIAESTRRRTVIDTMKALSCGGRSVMSLRASAFMFGIDDPRSEVVDPNFYGLSKDGKFDKISKLTRDNAEVAAKVFANCVLGGLVEV